MQNPKVLILVATFNRSNLIRKTLDSILGQSYTNWECLIVDDQSEDNTKEIIQQYINSDTRFSYFLKIKNYQKGLSGTRNFGLDLARQRKADFIQFFDDDDLMHPKKLELQLAPFFKNPTLNFTVCKYEKLVQNQNNWRIEQPQLNLKFAHLGDAVLTGEMKMNSLGPLWRSDFIQNFRFDERMKYAEEWELYTRIGYRYPNNYEVVEEYLFQYRKHQNSLTLGDDPDFERRKSSAVSRIKILEDLTMNRLHTEKSVLFLAQTFLLYSYNPDLVKVLRSYVKNHEGFSQKLVLFLNLGLVMGKYYRKILRKIAGWI